MINYIDKADLNLLLLCYNNVDICGNNRYYMFVKLYLEVYYEY